MCLAADICVWIFSLLGLATLVESFVALCISRIADAAAREAAAAAATARARGSSSSDSESDDDDDDVRAVEWTHDSLFSFYESLVKRNVPLSQKQKQRARLEELLDDLNGETHWWRLIRDSDRNGDRNSDRNSDDETAEHLPLRTRGRLYNWGMRSMETLARLIILDVFLLDHEPSLLAKERYLNDVFMPSLFKFKNVFVLHGHVQTLRRHRRHAPSSPPFSPPPSPPASPSSSSS